MSKLNDADADGQSIFAIPAGAATRPLIKLSEADAAVAIGLTQEEEKLFAVPFSTWRGQSYPSLDKNTLATNDFFKREYTVGRWTPQDEQKARDMATEMVAVYRSINQQSLREKRLKTVNSVLNTLGFQASDPLPPPVLELDEMVGFGKDSAILAATIRRIQILFAARQVPHIPQRMPNVVMGIGRHAGVLDGVMWNGDRALSALKMYQDGCSTPVLLQVAGDIAYHLAFQTNEKNRKGAGAHVHGDLSLGSPPAVRFLQSVFKRSQIPPDQIAWEGRNARIAGHQFGASGRRWICDSCNMEKLLRWIMETLNHTPADADTAFQRNTIEFYETPTESIEISYDCSSNALGQAPQSIVSDLLLDAKTDKPKTIIRNFPDHGEMYFYLRPDSLAHDSQKLPDLEDRKRDKAKAFFCVDLISFEKVTTTEDISYLKSVFNGPLAWSGNHKVSSHLSAPAEKIKLLMTGDSPEEAHDYISTCQRMGTAYGFPVNKEPLSLEALAKFLPEDQAIIEDYCNARPNSVREVFLMFEFCARRMIEMRLPPGQQLAMKRYPPASDNTYYFTTYKDMESYDSSKRFPFLKHGLGMRFDDPKATINTETDCGMGGAQAVTEAIREQVKTIEALNLSWDANGKIILMPEIRQLLEAAKLRGLGNYKVHQTALMYDKRFAEAFIQRNGEYYTEADRFIATFEEYIYEALRMKRSDMIGMAVSPFTDGGQRMQLYKDCLELLCNDDTPTFNVPDALNALAKEDETGQPVTYDDLSPAELTSIMTLQTLTGLDFKDMQSLWHGYKVENPFKALDLQQTFREEVQDLKQQSSPTADTVERIATLERLDQIMEATAELYLGDPHSVKVQYYLSQMAADMGFSEIAEDIATGNPQREDSKQFYEFLFCRPASSLQKNDKDDDISLPFTMPFAGDVEKLPLDIRFSLMRHQATVAKSILTQANFITGR
ncbi:hypothetical protein G7B40_011715 [Aetokthonos hydrillicola Thurmond2011]|uniref:Uncharacterized protein n=1 Tax=Aetokthonos hydrillicola Thurmond2011 TaxID=2712845 RepID=A0AAP5I8M0_9CYAN|nr:hypothetical protein [Aetokthonos hydrillicola]MBW4584684.1 hypothetical protein [Aetokthonos hydrillicola CCALA 1050]MDR9895228.1 hypothetical protein [Aetokthonos hydrillicola Thurmond2011]